MNVPDVSYARSGDVSIAYQVVGDGPTDLVFLPFRLDVPTLARGLNFTLTCTLGDLDLALRLQRDSITCGHRPARHKAPEISLALTCIRSGR